MNNDKVYELRLNEDGLQILSKALSIYQLKISENINVCRELGIYTNAISTRNILCEVHELRTILNDTICKIEAYRNLLNSCK